MFERMELRHWDPGIPWNDNFPKVAGTFGYLEMRKWNPSILLSKELCWKAFSLKGMQCKQWDPGIVCLWSSYLHVGLMEQEYFYSHKFIYMIPFTSSSTWGMTSLGEPILQHPGLILLEDKQIWEGGL